jgi:hypothetical protein
MAIAGEQVARIEKVHGEGASRQLEHVALQEHRSLTPADRA